MNRKLWLMLAALPILLGALGGCVVYGDEPSHYHHYWHDRY